jgi:hypothetical protein
MNESGLTSVIDNLFGQPLKTFEMNRLIRKNVRRRFELNRPELLEGYNLCSWNKSGLNYVIVSELTRADMEKFEDQFRAQTE